MPTASESSRRHGLAKVPTGIRGLDEITGGGLPRGRITLVCGGVGCGKTLFGVEFVVRGALDHGEPGVIVTFEESAAELAENVAPLGFDLDDLARRKLLALDHVRVDRSEIEETGEYDLEGLFVRLGHAIEAVGAKRVALDTIETLFAALPNEAVIRAELVRLFRWLKDRGVTAVITGERGSGFLTRHGLEEYVSDCVILLEQHVREQVVTRRMRIMKYRGSMHGTNEYPFLIEGRGLAIMPVTSLGLRHDASTERVSMGVERLDAMLAGGLYRGASVLVSGTAGTGKTSLAVHAAAAACARGERVLYFAFEESAQQIVRNMRSLGIDLAPFLASGLLRFHNARPTLFGLEAHLAAVSREIEQHAPRLVIVDPITDFGVLGSELEIRMTLMRMVDLIKSRGATAVFTCLTIGGHPAEQSEVGVSSLMDTWLLLRFVEGSGERNRELYVLKSRGMPHSNQLREFIMTDHGIEIADVYVGPAGVLTGVARRAQEARERAESLARREVLAHKKRKAERKRELLRARIASLQTELEAEEDEIAQLLRYAEDRELTLRRDRDEVARMRRADAADEMGVTNGARQHEGRDQHER